MNVEAKVATRAAKPKAAPRVAKAATPRVAKAKIAAVPREVKSRVPVSELNLRKAATRLLTSALVSTEVSYIQRVLGASATQEDLDAKVIAVRSMPWASIVIPD